MEQRPLDSNLQQADNFPLFSLGMPLENLGKPMENFPTPVLQCAEGKRGKFLNVSMAFLLSISAKVISMAES